MDIQVHRNFDERKKNVDSRIFYDKVFNDACKSLVNELHS